MNMLKFGYGVVLDGLPDLRVPDIPEFHFFLGSGRPQTRFRSNVVFNISEILECLERHMSGSQACRGSPQGPVEKEMCHLKAEKNKLFWMFTEPVTISLFCLLMLYVFSFYSITPLCPYYVCSNPIMIIFSVDEHHLAFL